MSSYSNITHTEKLRCAGLACWTNITWYRFAVWNDTNFAGIIESSILRFHDVRVIYRVSGFNLLGTVEFCAGLFLCMAENLKREATWSVRFLYKHKIHIYVSLFLYNFPIFSIRLNSTFASISAFHNYDKTESVYTLKTSTV